MLLHFRLMTTLQHLQFTGMKTKLANYCQHSGDPLVTKTQMLPYRNLQVSDLKNLPTGMG